MNFYTSNLNIMLGRLKSVLRDELEHAWHDAELRPKWKSRMKVEAFAEYDGCGWIKIHPGKHRKARILECRRVGEELRINVHIEGNMGFRRVKGHDGFAWRDVSFGLKAGTFVDAIHEVRIDMERVVKLLTHCLHPQPWRGKKYFDGNFPLANI